MVSKGFRIALVAMTMWRALAASDSDVPPDLDLIRYTENYDYLKDKPQRNEWWERTKLIYLDKQQTTSVSVGSETRVRYEWIKNDNSGLAGSDGYVWLRELPYIDFKYDENLRLFTQLIFADSIDKATITPLDRNRADVLQGFLSYHWDVAPEIAVDLQGGRQLLRFGSGRLVDVRYGPNVLQPFDAAKAGIDFSQWHTDVFYGHPTQCNTEIFDDEISTRQQLWGIYATRQFPSPLGNDSKFGADFYYFGYTNDKVHYEQGSGSELRHTLGSRLFGKASGWDWNYEFFLQTGRFNFTHSDGNILAWSVGTDTGYSLPDSPLQPRFGLRANIVSGDNNPHDRQLNTFNPMFPKGKYFGELSPVGPQNLINIQPNVDIKLWKDLHFTTTAGAFWRESTSDSIYDVGRHTVRPGDSSNARYIGTQWEALLSSNFGRNLSVSASYSEFHAGSFVRESGPSRTIKFVGLEVMFKF